MQVDPNVLVGHVGSDDAGVYRLSDDSALVLTVDYFTPIVDDPYDYGRVAATNSLSDVYAMGGRPMVALNIAGFPEGDIAPEILADILRGGADVATKAGVAIIGGHTVKDAEIKYGIAVVGMVDPNKMVTNAGAQEGDALILTKPLGTGVLATAHKNDRLDAESLKRMVDVMTLLNKEASELMVKHGAHAATDVTGYSLMGHGYELAAASGVTLEIDSNAVPLIDGALEHAAQGNVPGGTGTNRMYLQDKVAIADGVDENLNHLLHDPQTSGGLLIALPEANAAPLLDALRVRHNQAAIIGRCVEQGKSNVVVT